MHNYDITDNYNYLKSSNVNPIKMIKILVTGGAGFIGSHTCISLLSKGYEIVIVDSFINSKKLAIDRIKKICALEKIDFKNRIFLYQSDLRDIKSLENIFLDAYKTNNPIKGVVHFAGLKSVEESINNPIFYWDSNVNSSINLLKTMEKFSCNKLVFSSSASIYGITNKDLIDENSLIKPINPYGNSKYTIEIMLNDLFKSYSREFSVAKLRYFNPIGAHPSGLIGEDPLGQPNNIFPIILNKAYSKKENLKVFGNNWPTYDGTGVRDYIHVMDLAEGHTKTLEHLFLVESSNLTLNLGTGKGTSVLELIDIFEKSNNVKVPFEISKRRKGDTPKVVADNKLALKILNWEPSRTLENMCRDGWNWKLLNPNGYK